MSNINVGGKSIPLVIPKMDKTLATVQPGQRYAPPGLSGVTQLSLGQGYALAIRNGTVWSVGEGFYGSLATGSTDDQHNWFDTGLPAIYVYAGRQESYAIKPDGTLWFSGRGYYGQIGSGITGQFNSWIDTSLTDVKMVVSGDEHVLALKNNNRLYASGRNNYNVFGTGGPNTTSWVDTGYDFDYIATGDDFAYAIAANGDLYFGGREYQGQGGNAGAGAWSLSGLSNVAKVAAASWSGWALLDNGDVYAVGYNSSGQLGVGHTSVRSAWTQSASGATDIAATSGNSYIIKNGTVWSTGHGSVGANGLGTDDTASKNVYTDTGFEATSIHTTYTSGQSVMVRTADNKVAATGRHGAYQFGLGHNNNLFEFTIL